MERINLQGKRFHYLTVVKEAKTINQRRRWLCVCKCGRTKEVQQTHLIQKATRSCGTCIHKEIATTHGMRQTRFYSIFMGLKYRSENKDCKVYKHYGGRKVRNEWCSFQEFKTDMYKSYIQHVDNYGEKQTTIDRINNDGNYSQKNCRWATYSEQAFNRKRKC